MLHLRLFRILLLALLVVLLGILLNDWTPPARMQNRLPDSALDGSQVVIGGEFIEYKNGKRSLAGKWGLLEERPDGGLHVERIEALEIPRDGRGPLIVKAGLGESEGRTGPRTWRFEDEVVLADPESAMRLRLPSLEVDEAAGEARSSGEIRFGVGDVDGQAEALMYGLRGQPGLLTRPSLQHDSGGTLVAEKARLLDGFRDVEWVGQVMAVREGQLLQSDRLRILRSEEGDLRSMTFTGEVDGHWPLESDRNVDIATEKMEIEWAPSGDPSRIRLLGSARVQRGEERLEAATIEATPRDGSGWSVVAGGSVYVQGRFGAAPGLLRADSLAGELSEDLALRRASAEGRVSFEGEATRAEAARATFTAEPSERILLYGADLRKARLARGDTRVAADRIDTDPGGERLSAEGRVEASLLPDPSHAGGHARLFDSDDAVHFVSAELETEQSGSRLRFRGGVRGWQGERNIAAETIVVDQGNRGLSAEGGVSTRIPREERGSGVSEADYLQISADHLEYTDASGRAVYTGSVRVLLAEGWLEAERFEIDLPADTRKVREARAFGGVTLEFHQSGEPGVQRPISGKADRAVYTPGEATVRLYGDKAPATVRRIGEGGETTSGRVLSYRLDLGRLEVESGGPGPASIRTTGG